MDTDSSIQPLELRGVVYRAQGRVLLDGVSLPFVPGRRTVILGPNGAGKSLLLRLCHGLIQPSEGLVLWHGDPDGRRARRRQAMVFQRPVLLRRSVAANIDYALAVRGCPRTARQRRVDAAIELAGLMEIRDRPAIVLSGGEQQRVALARAWAVEPEVMFLDEPTANLDPAATRAVEGIIASIAELGTRIIMTTHDLGQARRLAEEIVFMHRGRILDQQRADDFFQRPGSEAARSFLNGDLPW